MKNALWMFITIFLITTFSLMFYTMGRHDKQHDIYLALIEQIRDGKEFSIKGMPNLKFYPRADGHVKYEVGKE